VLPYKIRKDNPIIIIIRYTNNDKNYPNPKDFKNIDLYKLFNKIKNKLEVAKNYLITATTMSINNLLPNKLNNSSNLS
jgi:hypothetical protein